MILNALNVVALNVGSIGDRFDVIHVAFSWRYHDLAIFWTVACLGG